MISTVSMNGYNRHIRMTYQVKHTLTMAQIKFRGRVVPSAHLELGECTNRTEDNLPSSNIAGRLEGQRDKMTRHLWDVTCKDVGGLVGL